MDNEVTVLYEPGAYCIDVVLREAYQLHDEVNDLVYLLMDTKQAISHQKAADFIIEKR